VLDRKIKVIDFVYQSGMCSIRPRVGGTARAGAHNASELRKCVLIEVDRAVRDCLPGIGLAALSEPRDLRPHRRLEQGRAHTAHQHRELRLRK